MLTKHPSEETSQQNAVIKNQGFSDILLEESPFAVCIFHPQTHKLIYNNSAANELMTQLGFTNSVREFWQALLIENPDFHQKLEQEGHVHNYEICRHVSSDKMLWLVLSCDILTFHGETSYGLWIQNITSRKEAEERLHDALDTMSDAFLLWDKDDRLVMMNDRVFELHPNSRDIYILGRTFEEIMRTGLEKGDFETPAGMTKQERLKQRLTTHKTGDYINIRQIKGRWLQVREQRTRKGNIVTTAIDVTLLKEQEQKLALTKEKDSFNSKRSRKNNKVTA